MSGYLVAKCPQRLRAIDHMFGASANIQFFQLTFSETYDPKMAAR